MSSANFDALLSAAPATFRRDLAVLVPGAADYAVDVPRLDHTLDVFRIRIHDAGASPEVEEIGGRLPHWCPERHIMEKGRFCLSWSPTPPALDTPDALTGWWQQLLGYLGLQLVAEETGTWPRSKEWAHGAAPEQHAFEERAKHVDARAVEAVERGTVSIGGGRVDGRRRPCPCGSTERVKDCHEHDLVELSGLLAKQKAKERAFWQHYALATCCRTMSTCPLNVGGRP